MNRWILMTCTLAVVLSPTASGQVENAVLSASGANLSDGSVTVFGEFAAGVTFDASDEADLGAVPCWQSTGCPGDINADGTVTLSDLSIVLGNFGLSGASQGDGDIDGDGDVDVSDLAALLGLFGTSC